MLRAVVVAALVQVVMPSASGVMPSASGQAPSVLHIKVVLVDAEGQPTPVPRHALLISDNPASAPPRRIVTALDGTVDVRLRPGNYTVESDQPVVVQRQGLPSGRRCWTSSPAATRYLELTADNAEVVPVPAVDDERRGRRSRPTPRSFCRNGRTASWRCGRRRTRASGFVIDVGRQGARRDEPAGHRHRDVGRGAADAGRQSGGERPRGRSRA